MTRVLVVDDDAGIRRLVRIILTDAGYEVREAEDGQKALALSHDEEAPAILLLDLNMPKKDGREALAEIKAHPRLRKIPVVVLTTSKADEDIVRSYDLGVNSFITKPVTFDGLVEAMAVFSHYWLQIVALPPSNGDG